MQNRVTCDTYTRKGSLGCLCFSELMGGDQNVVNCFTVASSLTRPLMNKAKPMKGQRTGFALSVSCNVRILRSTLHRPSSSPNTKVERQKANGVEFIVVYMDGIHMCSSGVFFQQEKNQLQQCNEIQSACVFDIVDAVGSCNSRCLSIDVFQVARERSWPIAMMAGHYKTKKPVLQN